MKRILFLFAILFALFLAIVLSQDYFKTGNFSFFKKEKVATITIKDHTFKLLLAKTPAEKEIGLSKHKSLPQDYGMLFLFDSPDLYSFWMRDMSFPIDIIYINDDQVVTILENNMPPKNKTDNLPVLQPKQPANRVLEINAGLSKKYGFSEGDRVKTEGLP